jgi:hypothetical protein
MVRQILSPSGIYYTYLLKFLPGKKRMRVRRKRTGLDDEFLTSALAAEFV